MGVRLLLREFVGRGNTLDERNEVRQEWLQEFPDDPYWYRAVIPLFPFPRGLFVELKLIDDDEEEPFVQIVSVHPRR
jgi:hypothetical protein